MSDRPPEGILWDFVRGALMTRAIGIVAELDVARALADSPRPVDEVAGEVGASADTLHRLLRALASDGVFIEVEPGVFGNTPASELLREEGKRSFARLFGAVWHRAAGELTAAGTASFPSTFGSDFWSWLAEHPEQRAAFDVAMADGNSNRAERLARVEWRGDETIVDVGGGNGSLLVRFLQDRTAMRGVVFDLPETVRDETAFGDRITFVAGSFFDSVPTAHAYVLSTILHDWDDERATAILRTIRKSAPAGAHVVILDSVVQPGNDPDGAKWLDLLMLVLFEGRERDDAQWRALLDGAGLAVESIESGLIVARCP